MPKDTTPKDSYAENAKQDKLNRDEREGYEKELKRQKEENEAPRKAVGEAVDKAVDYVKSKLKFKKGGSASARADGCCIRGKTRA
jgi:hypothetical protein